MYCKGDNKKKPPIGMNPIRVFFIVIPTAYSLLRIKSIMA